METSSSLKGRAFNGVSMMGDRRLFSLGKKKKPKKPKKPRY